MAKRAFIMPVPDRLVTAEELEHLPDDDYRYELVRGRLIRMSPVGFRHGAVVGNVLTLLQQHAKPGRLGTVAPEVGFVLTRHPDTVRAPDVAFVRRDREPARDHRGFFKGAPDLAVEVLSPDDRPSEIREKVEEYLAYGTRLVLVVDPDEEAVSIYRQQAAPIALRVEDTLDLDEVLPGFRCHVREMFE